MAKIPPKQTSIHSKLKAPNQHGAIIKQDTLDTLRARAVAKLGAMSPAASNVEYASFMLDCTCIIQIPREVLKKAKEHKMITCWFCTHTWWFITVYQDGFMAKAIREDSIRFLYMQVQAKEQRFISGIGHFDYKLIGVTE